MELSTQRSGKMLRCECCLSHGVTREKREVLETPSLGIIFNGEPAWSNVRQLINYLVQCLLSASLKLPVSLLFYYKLSDSPRVSARLTKHYFQGKLANFTKITIVKRKTRGGVDSQKVRYIT